MTRVQMGIAFVDNNDLQFYFRNTTPGSTFELIVPIHNVL